MNENENLKFIVTGTGRCGTVFLAKLLTGIGLSCGHESIFDYSNDSEILERLKNVKNRSLSSCSQQNNFIEQKKEKNWVAVDKIVADSSYLAAPYLSHPLLINTPVIHLFRNPIEVVSSYILDFNYFENKIPNKKNPYNEKGWENKIYRYLPELGSIETQIERACWFYIQWNQIIIRNCMFRKYLKINIENIDYKKLFNFLNIELEENTNLYKNTSSNTNKRRNKNLSINEIPNGFIKELFKNTIANLDYSEKVKKIF